MKIAYILAENIDVNGKSGASTHIREVIHKLEKRGHEVSLLSKFSTQETDYSQKIKNSNIINQFTPQILKGIAKQYKTRAENRSLVKNNQDIIEKCDLIYERDSINNFSVETIPIKKPWIIECNGIFWGKEAADFQRAVFRYPYKKKHIKKWKRADALIAVSHSFKERIVQYGVEEYRIYVAHNGIDIDRYNNDTINRGNTIRLKLSIAKDSIVLGFLGHIFPWHNIEYIIEAVKILREKNYPVYGLIVGGGRHKYYEYIAMERGIKEYMRFTGPIDYYLVPDYVSSMDICTIPGIYNYGSPVKLFEYGAAGKPMVAADYDSVKEIIDDTKNGLLFEADNYEAFLNRLIVLIEDADLRFSLGNALRKIIKKEYTWEKNVDRLEQVFVGVMENYKK